MIQIDGVLPLWKPAGMTSHQCVARARKVLGIQKVGHAGTLDPAVVGVLPLLLGKATKLADVLHMRAKTYEAVMTLGIATETEDATGKVTACAEHVHVTETDIAPVFASFVGTYTQTVPLYAAVHVDGKRLYSYAHDHVAVIRPQRQVTIEALTVISTDLVRTHPQITFEVTCSKGTYVRTLCVDIGEKLGYPARMERLRRTSCSGIAAARCVTWEQIHQAIDGGTWKEHVLSLGQACSFLPVCRVDVSLAKAALYGQPLPWERFLDIPECLMPTVMRMSCHRGHEDVTIGLVRIDPEKKTCKRIATFAKLSDFSEV